MISLMLDLSVIICTHNPRADYLRRTLSSLQKQLVPLDRWELLLIDNASLQPVVASWDLSWHSHGRHIAEPELGLSAARRRGIKESASDLLIFVDDDNVLDPGYLELALRIKRDWPLLGTWGSGSIVPEYELQPAEHLKRFAASYLALRSSQKPLWANVAFCWDATPWGAGLCVRKEVAVAYCQFVEKSAIQISGRKGASLIGHDDSEICLVGCSGGYGMGVFPELKLTHLISKERVSDDYIVRMVESSDLSGLLLEYKWQGSFPTSPFDLRGILSITKNVMTRRGFDRRVYLARLRAAVAARRLLNGFKPASYDQRYHSVS
jgi:glycosyltransferase involved in cell wall biosynthesis